MIVAGYNLLSPGDLIKKSLSERFRMKDFGCIQKVHQTKYVEKFY